MSTNTDNPPDNAETAAPGVTANMTVGPGKWADAWTAFFEALDLDGVTATNTYSPGFSVTEDVMHVTLCQRVPDVEPIAVGDGPDDEFAEWGWPIRIEVAR